MTAHNTGISQCHDALANFSGECRLFSGLALLVDLHTVQETSLNLKLWIGLVFGGCHGLLEGGFLRNVVTSSDPRSMRAVIKGLWPFVALT